MILTATCQVDEPKVWDLPKLGGDHEPWRVQPILDGNVFDVDLISHYLNRRLALPVMCHALKVVILTTDNGLLIAIYIVYIDEATG
jgi:hypothetical protein